MLASLFGLTDADIILTKSVDGFAVTTKEYLQQPGHCRGSQNEMVNGSLTDLEVKVKFSKSKLFVYSHSRIVTSRPSSHCRFKANVMLRLTGSTLVRDANVTRVENSILTWGLHKQLLSTKTLANVNVCEILEVVEKFAASMDSPHSNMISFGSAIFFLKPLFLQSEPFFI